MLLWPTTTSSANPPAPHMAMTRSPTLTLLTSAPNCDTTPATSAPGENGNGGLNWYSPLIISTAGKLIPAAFTWMRTPAGNSGGPSISSTTSDSGGPYALHNTALMAPNLPPSP